MSRLSNIRGSNILSLYTGHDASAVFIDKDNNLKILEYERFVKQRYASFTAHHANNGGIGTTDAQRNSFLQYIKDNLKRTIKLIIIDDPLINDRELLLEFFPEATFKIILHHEAHAASAFFTSPFNDATILSFDGGGTDLYTGDRTMVERARAINSLTYAKDPNTGKYAFCGPEGCRWHGSMTKAYTAKGTSIMESQLGYNLPLCDRPDTSWQFTLGIPYNHIGRSISEIKPGPDSKDHSLVYAGKIMGLCGYGKRREEWGKPLEQYYFLRGREWEHTEGQELDSLGSDIGMDLSYNALSGQDSYDLAATSQSVFEDISLKIIDQLLSFGHSKNIIIVGGCGLNVLFNQQLAKHLKKKNLNLYIPPWPNDCGLALGQLLHVTKTKIDLSVYSGFDILDREKFNDYKQDYNATKCNVNELVDLLKDGNIIGILQGNSEVGPRALGNRSIICDPSIKNMKDILNSKVKFREWYRPFAPVCRYQDSEKYFDDVFESKYMSYAPLVKEEYRETLPSITHVDGTARLQTVRENDHKLFYDILTELNNREEIPVILNTSFNIRGAPILTTIEDALHVLDNTEMDYVYIEGYIFKKK
jgi:carbamoyltransferase